MRLHTVLISIIFCSSINAQIPSSNKIYEEIYKYYTKNLNRIEYVRNVHKNALRYDTSYATFVYIPLKDKSFFISFLDSSFSFSDGFYFSDDYYILNGGKPEKIRVRKQELPGTMYGWLERIPAWHSSNFSSFKSWLGKPFSVSKSKTHFVVTTSKYIVAVDTTTFRIEEIIWIVYWKGKTQYNKYYYTQLPDSNQDRLQKTVSEFTDASKNFSITTFKELEKQQPLDEKLEGQKFKFANLVSMNKGELDSIIKGKYILYDFFYQACLPCHKMTGYILDWLPKIDSSKILLIGVNPFDSEYSMKLEVQKRKIDYPVIIGTQAKEIAKRYVQQGYPNLMLVSPDGIILKHHFGMSKSFLNDAEKIISQ